MEPSQLDIFADSRDTMLRNDVLRATEDRDSNRASAALESLRAEYPGDETIPALNVLANALARTDTTPLISNDAAEWVMRVYVDEVDPAARQVLPQAAAARWMAPLWRSLALRCTQLAYHAEHPNCHAAPFWLLAADPANAESAVKGIESWRRIPVPLGWMIEARHTLRGLDAVWPLLCELGWIAPARLDALLPRLGDRVLNKLRSAFDAEFEGEGGSADLAWFAAWALVDDNRLAPILGEAQTARAERPERTMRAILGVLHLERHGAHRELIDARKVLRELHAGLYAQYMKTR